MIAENEWIGHDDKPKRHVIESKFWFEDIVYLKVNSERIRGMITFITMSAGGSLRFGVSWDGGGESDHYACELSREYVAEYET